MQIFRFIVDEDLGPKKLQNVEKNKKQHVECRYFEVRLYKSFLKCGILQISAKYFCQTLLQMLQIGGTPFGPSTLVYGCLTNIIQQSTLRCIGNLSCKTATEQDVRSIIQIKLIEQPIFRCLTNLTCQTFSELL